MIHTATAPHLQETSDLSRIKRVDGVRNVFQSSLAEQTISKIIKLPHYNRDNYGINTLHFKISNLFCDISEVGRWFLYMWDLGQLISEIRGFFLVVKYQSNVPKIFLGKIKLACTNNLEPKVQWSEGAVAVFWKGKGKSLLSWFVPFHSLNQQRK